jgi:hypothetical protein
MTVAKDSDRLREAYFALGRLWWWMGERRGMVILIVTSRARTVPAPIAIRDRNSVNP